MLDCLVVIEDFFSFCRINSCAILNCLGSEKFSETILIRSSNDVTKDSCFAISVCKYSNLRVSCEFLEVNCPFILYVDNILLFRSE